MKRRSHLLALLIGLVLGWNVAFALASYARYQYLPMVAKGVAAQVPTPEPFVVSPPPNVNMQIEGLAVVQDGVGVVYYKDRDRGVPGVRPSRGEVVWKVANSQAVEVLVAPRSVSEANGTLAVINGYGYLVTIRPDNTKLHLPIPDWTRVP